MNNFVLNLETNELVTSTPFRRPSHEDLSVPIEVVERKHKREHRFRHASDARDETRSVQVVSNISSS